MIQAWFWQKLKVVFLGLSNYLFWVGLLLPQISFSSAISGLNLEDFYHQQSKDRWQNNPFVKPINRVKLDDLLLQAIIFSKEDQAVLINGEVLRKGSHVGGIEVISIHPDYVMVKHASGVFRLDIKGGDL